jgi:hypothetical protein
MDQSAIAKKLRALRRQLKRSTQPRRQRAAAPSGAVASGAARAVSKHSPRDRALQFAIAGFKGLVIVALPFVLYVRTGVELYSRGAPSWVAILVSTLLTIGVVAAYAIWLSRRMSGSDKTRSVAKWIAVPLVAAWSGYSLLYLAGSNAKSDDVRAHYTSLHPVLRAALSTIILVNPDLVITDMARQPVDYARMGLPANQRTRHYEQPDGWVHAVDLRTIGRGEIENRAVQLYFWSMGFSTLRHVGTADHLHVQLRKRD